VTEIQIREALDQIAPDNEHPIPFGTSLEREEDPETGDDRLVWHVFLDIRSLTLGEIGADAANASLELALKVAFAQLRRLVSAQRAAGVPAAA
jgi:hypothetical protein